MIHSSTYYDYTGLTSGHKRPVEVEQAYSAMLDAWAVYNDACDRLENGDPMVNNEILTSLRTAAIRMDGEYSRIYDEAYSMPF